MSITKNAKEDQVLLLMAFILNKPQLLVGCGRWGTIDKQDLALGRFQEGSTVDKASYIRTDP